MKLISRLLCNIEYLRSLQRCFAECNPSRLLSFDAGLMLAEFLNDHGSGKILKPTGLFPAFSIPF